MLKTTYASVLRQGEEALLAAGVAEAKTDSRLLFSYAFGMDLSEYFLRKNEPADTDAAQKFLRLIKDRALRVPVQYLTGTQEFMGLSFAVNPHVLIPRQDTECLAQAALPHVVGKRVLDLCTGSGCLAVCLAVLGHTAACDASDISKDALAVARDNAKSNGAKVNFVCSDLFEQLSGCYDVIVSNPPYVRHAELETLACEVKNHEPRTALDGGADGLSFYRRIFDRVGAYLSPGGRLFLEIDGRASADVFGMMQREFDEVSVQKDLAGTDRVVTGRFAG